MQQSRTLCWPEPSTDITTFSNYLRETSCRNKTPWSKNNYAFTMSLNHLKRKHNPSLTPSLSFFTSPLAARLFPSNTASPILFLLPYSLPARMCYSSRTNLPLSLCIPNLFPQHLSGDLQLTGWHSLCQRLPDNSRIVHAMYFETADADCVVDRHVVWEV